MKNMKGDIEMEWTSNLRLIHNAVKLKRTCKEDELSPELSGYIYRGNPVGILEHVHSHAATNIRPICGLEELSMMQGWLLQAIPVKNPDYVLPTGIFDTEEEENISNTIETRFRGTFFELFPELEV